jgi:hypothetical protein
MEKSKSKLLLASMKKIVNLLFENVFRNPSSEILHRQFDPENAYLQEAACDPENCSGS